MSKKAKKKKKEKKKKTCVVSRLTPRESLQNERAGVHARVRGHELANCKESRARFNLYSRAGVYVHDAYNYSTTLEYHAALLYSMSLWFLLRWYSRCLDDLQPRLTLGFPCMRPLQTCDHYIMASS